MLGCAFVQGRQGILHLAQDNKHQISWILRLAGGIELHANEAPIQQDYGVAEALDHLRCSGSALGPQEAANLA